MAIEIRMPEIAADVEHADLLAWLVEPGERVSRGDPILEIETDKSTVEIEAPASGILSEIRIPAGTVDVAAGVVLGLIEESDQPADDGAEPPVSDPPDRPAEPAPEPEPPAEPTSAPEPPAAARSTALARRVAEREGIDLSTLEGSGLHGRIVRADVEAGRATRGHGESPMLRLEADCNADALMAAADDLAGEAANPPIPLEAWIIRAAALGAQELSEFGAPPSEGPAREGGPGADILFMGGAAAGAGSRIREAHRKGLAVLSAELDDPPAHEAGDGEAPLALAHLDLEGIDRHWPVPPAGARASLGFTRPRRAPVSTADGVQVGYVLTLTLSADPTGLDSGGAGRLLAAVRRRLEHPLEMTL